MRARAVGQVHNRSDIPVVFTWKQFGTVDEEEAERARLHADLEKMQSLEEEYLEVCALDARGPRLRESVRGF